MHGRSAVVTGAASGIGRATALLLAERGCDLFLCDIDEAGLEDTAGLARKIGRRAHTHRVDVADRAQMKAFADATHAEVEAVDLLINNAGVAISGTFADTSLDDWKWIVDINVHGVVHGMHFFAPQMVARGRGGHIVNIASLGGYLGVDTLPAYSATKFAVKGLSQAVSEEFREHGIDVTAICPSTINTPLTRNARMAGGAEGDRDELIQQFESQGGTPEQVALGILDAVRRRRLIAPIAAQAWILWALTRLAPTWTQRLMGLINRKQRAQRSNG